MCDASNGSIVVLYKHMIRCLKKIIQLLVIPSYAIYFLLHAASSSFKSSLISVRRLSRPGTTAMANPGHDASSGFS